VPDTVGERVKGLVVAIGLGDLVYVGEVVYETEVVIVLVKGNVVGTPVFERVCVTD